MKPIYRIVGDYRSDGKRTVAAVKIERDLKRRFPDKVLASVSFECPLNTTAEQMLDTAIELLDKP